MNDKKPTMLELTLLGSFVLFAFTSTFSIAISQFCLGISIAMFLVLLIVKQHTPIVESLRIFYLAASLWVGWLLFTALLGETPVRSLRLSREEWLFLAVPVGIVLFQRPGFRRWVTGGLATGVTLIGVYCLFQYFTGEQLLTDHRLVKAPGFGWRALGGFNNYMTFGNYFAVASAALLALALAGARYWQRNYSILIGTAAVLGIVATFLSFTRGAIAGLIGAVIVLFIVMGRRHMKISLIVLAALIVGLVAVPGVGDRYVDELGKEIGGTYEGGRMFIWKHSLMIIEDNPIVGVGQGNFQREYAELLPPDTPEYRLYTHAHNDLLNVGVSTGLPGMLIYLGLWVVVLAYFWSAWRQLRSADDDRSAYVLAALIGSICFFGTSLTEATFVDEEVRALLMFLWGVGLFPWYKEQKEKVKPPGSHGKP